MRIIFGLILSIGFCFGQTDDIGFSYGILGRLQSVDEKITILYIWNLFIFPKFISFG